MTNEDSSKPTAPPGWYLDKTTGRTRWWNGNRWTDDRPAQPSPTVVYVPAQRGTNGWAVAALVVGILAILTFAIPFVGFILGIFGVALGADGLRRSKAANAGHGIALAGTILSAIPLGIGLIGFIALLNR